MSGRAESPEPDERTRWERLQDDVADAGPNLGQLHSHMSPGSISLVLARAAQRDIAQAHEDAQEQASAMAVAGNPRRADYIEHMARRLAAS